MTLWHMNSVDTHCPDIFQKYFFRFVLKYLSMLVIFLDICHKYINFSLLLCNMLSCYVWQSFRKLFELAIFARCWIITIASVTNNNNEGNDTEYNVVVWRGVCLLVIGCRYHTPGQQVNLSLYCIMLKWVLWRFPYVNQEFKMFTKHAKYNCVQLLIACILQPDLLI